ncbi:MAG: hypothetical protein B6D37_02460 [Sphingobacteriales bacterium UTBCD1]|jgi:uncharacterized membrane protein|nr:MAG: hypothetical protein B6D37_02460 [Sphingobacteriales bacterium UTBCD1]
MPEQKVFAASEESKAKAKQLRLFAILAWLVAIGGEIFAIFKLIHNETLTWLIVAIVVILILAVTGSILWKRANRLDPASEKDKTKFFIQNQLGAIIGVLAFLPLVIAIFMNKNIDKKTKGIAGVIAIIAMLIAGITGIDFNPPSIEKYSREINQQDSVLSKLTPGNNLVYLAKEGTVYHIYQDCQYIRNRDGVTQATIKQAFDQRGLSQLCKVCEKRAMKERNVNPEEIGLKGDTRNAADSSQ